MTRVSGPWIDRPETQAVCQMLTRQGHQVYFVGGCVRDALLGRPVGDIDLSTDALPETVMALAAASGLRAVPTGIEHGTVTVVSGGIAHEITTFRRDVATDGRRAVVRFATSLHEDALRRDFTINALYADPSGAVTDPVDGLPDLHVGTIRFIEDPVRRIREDYLRILRFFRFYAWYGNPSHGADHEALSAIATNADGLDQLSRERVGKEMMKLLGAQDPTPALASMRITGVLPRVLPGAEARMIGVLVELERMTNTPPSALRRLAALGGGDTAARLRLSRRDQATLDHIRTGLQEMMAPGVLGYRWGTEVARDVILIRAALAERAPSPRDFSAARAGAAAEFPLHASDLMPALAGPALGARLKALEKLWIASSFAMDRDALLVQSATLDKS